MRRACLWALAALWVSAACGTSEGGGSAGASASMGGAGSAIGAGGSAGAGQSGAAGTATGGASGVGGAAGGTGGSATGGSATGGSATGGTATGGASGSGGITGTGGTPVTSGTGGAAEAGLRDATSAGSGGRESGASSDARADAAAPLDASARADASSGTAPATLWIAGDSTVQTYAAGNVEGNGGTELEGWGQEIGQFFTSQITVQNKAIGGRSVAFFMWSVVRDAAGTYLCVDDQGNPQYQLDASGNRVDTSQWSQIKSGMKPGDFLLIQFGTNDETHDCPRFVSLPDFEADLGIMADMVRARGGTPIFVTPMSHRSFVGTTVNNTLLPYANAMKSEATTKSVEVADLNLRSVEYFQMVGNTFLATNIFDTGTTHFIQPGAIEMAQLIVGEIRKNRGPLAAYLK